MSVNARDRLRIEAANLKARALGLREAGNADERWDAVCLLRDAAHQEIAARGLASEPGAEGDVAARVEAATLFLLAKDPLRALNQWSLLPREAFSTEEGAAPVSAMKSMFGDAVGDFARAFREVLGDAAPPPAASLRPDQVRALLEAFPGVAELWWGLSQCTASAGEAEMARARAARLDPSMSDDAAARAAWDGAFAALLFPLRIEIRIERPGGRLDLETASRVTAAFAALLTAFAEKTTDARAEIVATRASATPGALLLDAVAEGLHPFAIEDLARDLGASDGRADPRAALRLLSLLHEHRLRLTASLALTRCEADPALVLDEGRRKSLIRAAEAGARRAIDSRDVPQADDIDRVLRAVERIAKDGGDPPDVTSRQSSYYRRAAKMLGLLTESEEPTPAGRLIARLDSATRMRAAVFFFEASPCGDAWIAWRGGRTLLDVDPKTAAEFLREHAPGLSKDTAERRAQTLAAWHRALVAHHYGKGVHDKGA